MELNWRLIKGRSHSGGPKGLMFAEKSRRSSGDRPVASAIFFMFPPCSQSIMGLSNKFIKKPFSKAAQKCSDARRPKS
jgi:hypothetical protein